MFYKQSGWGVFKQFAGFNFYGFLTKSVLRVKFICERSFALLFLYSANIFKILIIHHNVNVSFALFVVDFVVFVVLQKGEIFYNQSGWGIFKQLAGFNFYVF